MSYWVFVGGISQYLLSYTMCRDRVVLSV